MARFKSFYHLPYDEWILSCDNSSNDPREPIRQWLLRELLETYFYPFEWIGNRIQFSNPKTIDGQADFYGLRILTPLGNPYALISITVPDHYDEAVENLRQQLQRGKYTIIGIVSDGSIQGTRLFRRRFDSDECEYIVELDTYSEMGKIPAPRPFANTATEFEKPRLQRITKRVETVFFVAHGHIRDIDGLHADEALDELAKILYVKLYDEEMTPEGQPYRCQTWIYGSSDELAASIREVYDEARQHDVRVFGLRIPGYRRSRGVFNKVIRLSSPALAKVVETLQAYSLSNSRSDIKGRAFQQVLSPSVRAGMGQYFTPVPVVKFIVGVVQPKLTELILDPFSGSGRFLSSSLNFVSTHSDQALSKRLHDFAYSNLHGIEKSERMVRIAMTDMRLHGDGHSNIRCVDSLLDFSNYADLLEGSFDVVMTNPPFGAILSKQAISKLGSFTLSQGRSRVPLEILGLERCVQFLRPGGRLAIVVPDGLLANRGRGASSDRLWLQSKMKIRAIVGLPVETFAPYGANIKTSIIFARKWTAGESIEQDYPVFLGRIDNVGYDASDRVREGAEFCQLSEALCTFLQKYGW